MKLHQACAAAAASASLSPFLLLSGISAGAGLAVGVACTFAGVAWGLAISQQRQASLDEEKGSASTDAHLVAVQQSALQVGARVTSQFQELDEELTQIRGIISSATDNLSGSLKSLESASSGQTELLRDMVDELVSMVNGPEMDEQSRELRRFAEETQGIVNRLLDVMDSSGSPLGGESQTALVEMTDQIRAANERVVAKWRTIIEVSERIRSHVLTGIVSLQFEDMAGQLIEHVRRRQVAVQEAFQQLSAALGNYGDAPAFHEALRKLEAELDVRFDGLSRKSVSQTSVETGSVDLF